MKKEKLNELLATMWCILNCSTDNESTIKAMDFITKRCKSGLPMEKWRKFSDGKGGTFAGALRELKRLLK